MLSQYLYFGLYLTILKSIEKKQEIITYKKMQIPHVICIWVNRPGACFLGSFFLNILLFDHSLYIR